MWQQDVHVRPASVHQNIELTLVHAHRICCVVVDEAVARPVEAFLHELRERPERLNQQRCAVPKLIQRREQTIQQDGEGRVLDELLRR